MTRSLYPAVACLRCAYRWRPKVPVPADCARCGSAFWDHPRLPTGKHRYGHVEARRCRTLDPRRDPA